MKARFLVIFSAVLLLPMVVSAQIPTTGPTEQIAAAKETGGTMDQIQQAVNQGLQLQKVTTSMGTAMTTMAEFASDPMGAAMNLGMKNSEFLRNMKDQYDTAMAAKNELEAAKDEAIAAGKDMKDAAVGMKDAAVGMKDMAVGMKDMAVSQVSDAAGSVGLDKNKGDSNAPSSEDTTENNGTPNEEIENGNILEENNPNIPNIEENGLTSVAENRPLRAAWQTDSTNDLNARVAKGSAVGGARNLGGGLAPVSSAAPAAVSVDGAMVATNGGQPNAQVPIMTAPAEMMPMTAGNLKVKALANQAMPKLMETDSDVLEKPTAAESPSSEDMDETTAGEEANSSSEPMTDKQKLDIKSVAATAAVKASLSSRSLATKPMRALPKANRELTSSKELKLDNKKELSRATIKAKDAKALSVKPNAKLPAANLRKEIKSPSDIKANELKNMPSPRRRSFTTSDGYGHSRTTTTLAFASATASSSDSPVGITFDGVLVVPKPLVTRCDVGHKEAAEKDGAFGDCLAKVATQSTDSKLEFQKRMNALTDLTNGYAEYLAAAYFEALEIYNDSLTYKNKVVDQIITSDVPDIQSAWVYLPEMNQAMSTRINNLNKLWARNLGVTSYGVYTNNGAFNLEDEKDSQEQDAK